MTDTDAPPTDPDAKTPEADKAPDDKGKRPTTRAGRAAKTATRKATASKDKPPRATTPAPRRADLETRLQTQLATIGLVVSGVGGMTSPAVQADGILIVSQSATVAKALADVAKNDPKVARILERTLTVGTYGALAGALAPLAIGIAANHGMVPRETAAALGVEVPDLAGQAPMQPPAPYDPTTPPPAAGGPIY